MSRGYLRTQLEVSGGPGTEAINATGSTKIIYRPVQSVDPTLNPVQMDRSDEVRGIDDTVTQTVSEYKPAITIAQRLTPDITGAVMCDVFGLPTTTAGNGVIVDPDSIAIPTGAYRHVWTVPVANLATTKATIAYRDQGVFYDARGLACSKVDLSISDADGTIAQQTFAVNYLNRIADPSFTPALESLAVLPFKRQNITLSWLSGSATTDDFTCSIENPIDQAFSVGSGSKYPDILLKGDGPIKVSGGISKRVLNATDYDALVNGTTFAWKIKWASDSFATAAYRHSFWMAGPQAQYIGGDGANPLTAARRIGADFNWMATSDGATASVTVTLVNTTASYA